MTVAGVRTRSRGVSGRSGARSKRPVVVARATLSVPALPAVPLGAPDAPVENPVLASRRDLHVARRLRRRDALAGLGVLAVALGATVGVLDMIH